MSFWEAFGNGAIYGMIALGLCVLMIAIVYGVVMMWNESRRGVAIFIAVVIFLVICGFAGVLVQHFMDS